jgi:hypothetical protein
MVMPQNIATRKVLAGIVKAITNSMAVKINKIQNVFQIAPVLGGAISFSEVP